MSENDDKKPPKWSGGGFYPRNLKVHLVSDSLTHYLELRGDVPTSGLVHRWLGHHNYVIRRRDDATILQLKSDGDVAAFLAAYRVWLDGRGAAGTEPASS